jgi:hypothetical protein
MTLEIIARLQISNIQFPPAKLLRRSFGALAKAEVLYGGQVEQGMPNDEVFSSLPLVYGSAIFHGKSNPKSNQLFSFYIRY